MTNPIREWFAWRALRRIAEAEAATREIRLSEPVPGDFCIKCGGWFSQDKMRTVRRLVFTYLPGSSSPGIPSFELSRYCQRCTPPATLVLVLQNTNGNVLDERFFRMNDGWLQDVDERTGEERCTVSCDEFNHTFCTSCGSLIEETECKGCRRKANSKS